MAKDYKYKINMEDLKGFLMTDKEPTKEQLHALDLVINVVLIKHFSYYREWWPDLKGHAVIAAFEHKPKYDPSFAAYPYLYTLCRNEIGNKLSKYTREVLVDNILDYSKSTTKISTDEGLDSSKFPKELSKFKKHFTGELDFKYIELSPEESLNLCLFIDMHANHRAKRLPEFLYQDLDKALLCTYKYASKL